MAAWSRLRTFLLFTGVVVAVGCGGTDEPDNDAGGIDSGPPPGRVELGVGRSVVGPFPPDGRLPIVYGVQGGYHVDVGVRLYELDPMDLELLYELVDVATSESLGSRRLILTVRRVVAEDDHWVRAGDQVIFSTITSPSEVDGAQVIIRVTATPVEGAAAMDERTVTIVDEGR